MAVDQPPAAKVSSTVGYWIEIFLFIGQIFPIPLFQKKILLEGSKTLTVVIEKLQLVHKVFLICNNQSKYP